MNMAQAPQIQFEEILHEIAKDNGNFHSAGLKRLIEKFHRYRDALEKNNNDLRQQVARLKKSSSQYYDRYDSAPGAFFILDDQGHIQDVNPAGTELIGAARNHLINTELAQHVAPEFADAFFYHRKWTLETDRKETCELKMVKEDCSTFFARIESKAIPAGDNNNKHIQTLVSDISAQKQTEGALELARIRADDTGKVKNQFLSKMSHEFRTPLNHIIGFTQLALDGDAPGLDEARQQYLNAVLESSHQLLNLVNDILDLSKLEEGTLQPDLSGVNLKALLKSSLAEFRQKATNRGMSLLDDVDSAPEAFQADERMLKQTLYHLLTNAIKFTPDGGEVLLRARMVDCIVRAGRRSGDATDFKIFQECIDTPNMDGAGLSQCIEVSVADTGIGLKPEDQTKIFEPFKQVDESMSRRHQGPGIGLPLAKKLVELHGGKLWAESEGPDKGAVFLFILPI